MNIGAFHISTTSGVSPIEAGYGLVHADTLVATTGDALVVSPANAKIELCVEGKTTSGSIAALALGPGNYDGALRVVACPRRLPKLGQGPGSARDAQGAALEKPVKLLLVEPGRVCRRFGARYGALEYDLPVIAGPEQTASWASLWKTGAVADIVVDFDAPWKFVLWRGMSYAPSWALANSLTSNFFVETLEPGRYRDCCEIMSDRECRYSHARIVHTSDARAVLHWRYALCDSDYDICRNYWVNELYYVYPDGVAARQATLYLDPRDPAVWQDTPGDRRRPYAMMTMPKGTRSFNDMEFISVNPAGAAAEDVTPPEALTILDDADFTRTFRWPLDPVIEGEPTPALDAYIFRMNYRNRPAVFAAAPGAGMQVRVQSAEKAFRYVAGARVEDDRWEPVAGVPTDFYVGVHWPVTRGWGTTPLTDRAQFRDRPTHTFLGFANAPPAATRPDGAVTWIWLSGMAPAEDGALRDVARAWLYPPPITNTRYCPGERAYVVEDRAENERTVGGDRPLVNPVFILPGVARGGVTVWVNDRPLDPLHARVGVECTLDGERTVIACQGAFPAGSCIRFAGSASPRHTVC
ncbi:MAG: hypothetical protein HYV36_06340 [Lentisphaerae bacterium]|nr:hypothetical protein [Lentisphaerota bacterium]